MRYLIIIFFLFYDYSTFSKELNLDNKNKFVFKKLYDEYGRCAVYYTILSSGIKKRPNYSDEDEKQYIHIKGLRDGTEKILLNFAEKLSINNDQINTDLRLLFREFNKKIENNYSKIDVLDKIYALSCKESLLNIKGRIEYWENYNEKLENNSDIKSILGKTFLCKSNVRKKIYALTILNDTEAKRTQIKDLKIQEMNMEYKLDLKRLNFYYIGTFWKSIDRSSLKLSSGYKCEIFNEDGYSIMKYILDQRIKEIKSQRKF